MALEVEFFRVNDIVQMEEVAKLVLHAVSAAFDIGPIDPELLLDVSVQLFKPRMLVSHFCVNSASWSPEVKLGALHLRRFDLSKGSCVVEHG